MKIVNLNPDIAIGASSWMVELDGNRLLMDAGTHPKREGRASLPLYGAVSNADVDAIAVEPIWNFDVRCLRVLCKRRADV